MYTNSQPFRLKTSILLLVGTSILSCVVYSFHITLSCIPRPTRRSFHFRSRARVALRAPCHDWLGLVLSRYTLRASSSPCYADGGILGTIHRGWPGRHLRHMGFLGMTFFFIKAKKGSDPYLIPSVFGAGVIDISFIADDLFPYPYYTGRVLVFPLMIHCGLCILASATIFPSTRTTQLVRKCPRTLAGATRSCTPRASRHIQALPFGFDVSSTVQKITGLVPKAEGGLGPAATLRLVKSDVIWDQFAPAGTRRMQEFGRRLLVHTNGLDIFFTLIDPTLERFPVLTHLPSKPSTPASSCG
ncbi:uncharacterized protein B0H18DRAFT_626865 [Fomitopsis serialis]|uniref:uncharacterized protein n=1 Tax=Fomitopsis serialis TaxID=139415 RepID=UPI002008A10A|nr:uncharacterized protein B0H18DRAFT_626865 [Neoantrodia serialis]KAH9919736.1 hypothetical protein B0H18DRAFT_626865 [Neoantrodia serialis]